MGYRGSGKTSIGKKLATQLWKTFADVDVEISKRFGGKTVAEIWRDHGEPDFRAVEVQVTLELLTRDDVVIALAGGTVMQPAARTALQAASAKRIYLKAPPEVLYERISGDITSASLRPALTDKGGGLDEIETILAERGPVYEAIADITLDVSHLGIDDAVRYITSKLL